MEVDSQNAITKDNVKIGIDGVMYYKITDVKKASYEVKDPIRALSLLAQTSMRSEIGKLDLDTTFLERETLNTKIRKALNAASEKWGIECMRYEIKDIKPPQQIRRSMELQAESERIKRSKILESEGIRQSMINIADGDMQQWILEGEGEASKINQQARAIVESINNISISLSNQNDTTALKLKLTQTYIDALGHILKKTKVIMLPESSGQ